jgi:hypothetical protein
MVIHDIRTPIDAIERGLKQAQVLLETEFNAINKEISKVFEYQTSFSGSQ